VVKNGSNVKIFSKRHVCASFKIEDFNKDYHVRSIWVIMVTRRVTIKGFALACKRFAVKIKEFKTLADYGAFNYPEHNAYLDLIN